MPSASTGKLEYESGRTAYAQSALTDSGDATTFSSSASLFSRYAGEEPVVRPNGVVSGLLITPHADSDKVSISAGTIFYNGAQYTIAAGTATITRDAEAYLISSITVNSAGTFAATAGTDDSSAFSETRAAAGGPALLATTVIELGQVRTTSTTSAAIATSEIYTTRNVHREDAYFPAWTENDADASITFTEALMQNHTGPVGKAVYASYSDPSFSEQLNAVNFVAVEETASQNSTAVYNNTVGSVSTSLNQGSFTFYPREGSGVTDAILSESGKQLWFRFYPSRSGARYVRGNAILNTNASYPADDNISVACTLSGSTAFTRHAS